MENMIIRTNNLTKEYGKQKAVDNANLTLKEGGILGLIGKNGAGKTTLMRMITGLTQPTSGEIELFGKTSNLSTERRRTGSLIEAPALFPFMNARDNLEYYRIQRGIHDKKEVDRVLELIGLANEPKKPFKKYSLGMKQRLGLGVAMLGKPELLILDEPINGLDPTGIIDVRKLLLKLNREFGTTILISSHILKEMSMVVNSYAFIDNGKILEELTQESLSEKLQRFIRIKVNDAAKASVVLEKKLNTSKFKVTGDNEILLHDFVDDSETVSKALFEEGIAISKFSVEGIELEDYYLKLIGGGQYE